MSIVYAVVGDIGAAKEMYAGIMALPPEVEVRWFVDPAVNAKAGTEFLAKLKNPVLYEIRGPEAGDKPDLIVIGTSVTSCNGQIAWTKWGFGRYPVVWVEDLWGTGEYPSVLCVRPDEMLVVDEMAARIARGVRFGLKTTIVGKPTFGTIPNASRQVKIRRHVRKQFLIEKDEFLLTIQFGGDLPERTLTQLPEIVGLLRSLSVVVAFRFDPKHPWKEKLWAAACESGLDIIDARALDLSELNIASNMIIADWGNTHAYKALLCGTPTATLLFPKHCVVGSNKVFDDYVHRVNRGFPGGVPPIVTSLSWGAESPEELMRLIGYVIRNEADAKTETIERALQFRHLATPGAAERMAREFMKYIA